MTRRRSLRGYVTPTVAVAVSTLVMEGASGQIVITSVAVALLQLPMPLLTVMMTLVVPAAVGVPEMTFRFDPLPSDKPGGNGAAVYWVPLFVLVAVIV